MLYPIAWGQGEMNCRRSEQKTAAVEAEAQTIFKKRRALAEDCLTEAKPGAPASARQG